MITACVFLGFALIVFNGFLVYAYRKYGITKSISATFDKLEKENKQWIFQTVQFGFSACIFIASTIGVAEEYLGWQSMFLPAAATAIIFSSLAGDTEEDEIVMRNHTYGAIGGILLGSLFMAFTSWFWFFVAALGGLVSWFMVKEEIENRTYITEVIWFHLVLITLLVEIL
jgi:hypothetical protein